MLEFGFHSGEKIPLHWLLKYNYGKKTYFKGSSSNSIWGKVMTSFLIPPTHSDNGRDLAFFLKRGTTATDEAAVRKLGCNQL